MKPTAIRPSQTRFRVGSGGVLYLMVSAILLAAAIYTQANLLFWGFGLMVGGLVVSIGFTAVALRGLTLRRLTPSHGVANEPLVLRYRLANRGWLPAFGVVLCEAWERGAESEGLVNGSPHAWVAHLKAGQSVQVAATCLPRHRGEWTLRRVEASTSFPFSILHKTVAFEMPGRVLILPPLYRVQRRLLAHLTPVDGEGHRRVDRAGGGEEFFGVRDYRPGDSPRMIDWKRSARTGDLVSRELTQPRPPQLSLLLDLRRSGPRDAEADRLFDPDAALTLRANELAEQAISLAASLICEAYLHGFQVGLRVLGADAAAYRPRHSLPHRTRLLESLARLQGEDRQPHGRADPVTERADVIIWAGRGTGLPRSAGPAPTTTTVLGAADFEQYVTHQATLRDLNQSARPESRPRPRRAVSPAPSTLLDASTAASGGRG
jgi:uncharacterized protein (DUF58 family)